MSDILILSPKSFLSIECKFLSNISYDKDVKEVQERILEFINGTDLKPLQILLLKEKKWINSKLGKNELNWDSNVPIIVLYWEELSTLIRGNGAGNEATCVADYLDRN
jgi:hypothetical protein